MADNLEDLRSVIASRADYEDGARVANQQLQQAREGVRELLVEFVGDVLPLAGIASVSRIQAGGNDSEPIIYSVSRKSITDSEPATFGPDYFRVNMVNKNIVLLGAPDSDNPKIGLVALIDSIRIASHKEIFQVNRPATDGVAQ